MSWHLPDQEQRRLTDIMIFDSMLSCDICCMKSSWHWDNFSWRYLFAEMIVYIIEGVSLDDDTFHLLKYGRQSESCPFTVVFYLIWLQSFVGWVFMYACEWDINFGRVWWLLRWDLQLHEQQEVNPKEHRSQVRRWWCLQHDIGAMIPNQRFKMNWKIVTFRVSECFHLSFLRPPHEFSLDFFFVFYFWIWTRSTEDSDQIQGPTRSRRIRNHVNFRNSRSWMTSVRLTSETSRRNPESEDRVDWRD